MRSRLEPPASWRPVPLDVADKSSSPTFSTAERAGLATCGAVPKLDPQFSFGEELSHAITHGIGLVLSVAFTVIMVLRAASAGDAGHVVGVLIFGLAMINLYAASTMCHALPDGWQSQRVFEMLDFTGIYALIAGTYTPFMLGPLRGPWGWSILAAVWIAAVVGIVLELLSRPRNVRRSLVIYLGMGWLGLLAAFPLTAVLPTSGLLLLFAGGITYTVGVVFYLWRGFLYHHAVWHAFVLVGTGLHVLAAYHYAIP